MNVAPGEQPEIVAHFDRTSNSANLPVPSGPSLTPYMGMDTGREHYTAGAEVGTRRQREELSQMLAAAYLRLLRQRAANFQSEAQLEPLDSPESRCYGVAPE